MSKDEAEIEKLEKEFPTLAGIAFSTAREEALLAGLSVLQSEGEFIYEVFPDGTKKPVKKIEPRIKVTPGTIYHLE